MRHASTPSIPRRVEVVLVEHPSIVEDGPPGSPVVLGRSTDPDLIAVTEICLEEQAKRAVAYLEHAKRPR
jgi:hypothetical protein